MIGRVWWLGRACSFAAGVLLCLNAAAQTPPAGSLALVNGAVQALSTEGAARALARGDAVFPGETVTTGVHSYALIRFSDQGTAMLRPSTQFVIEKYQFNRAAEAPPAAAAAPAAPAAAPPSPANSGETASESSFFRLLRGGLRMVSGLISHADYSHFSLATPVATMGIRGTDFLAVTCEEACQADPVVTRAVPPGETTQGATVSGAYNGTITVTSITGHSLTLHGGQFAITLADGTQYMLDAEPAFLNSGEAAGSTGTTPGAAHTAQWVKIGSASAAIIALALMGAVLAGSGGGSGGTNSTTGTTGTTGTAPAH